MFYQLTVFCFILIAIKVMLKKSRFDPPLASNCLPLIGHLHIFVGLSNADAIWNKFMKMSTECTEKGGVIKFKMGPRVLYVVTDPEDCLKVSKLCLTKDYFYNFTRNFLGITIFTAYAKTWKNIKRLLNPAFNIHVLNSFMEIFNSKARQFTDQLTVDEPFDISKPLYLSSLETICKTAIGLDFEEDCLYKQYLKWQNELLAILTERFMTGWFHLDCIYKYTSLKKKEDNVVKKLHGFTNSIIQRKKDSIKLARSEKVAEKLTDKFKPFMDLILELADETGHFTDEQVRGETDTIIRSGHDTSATTLTFALILLGTYPEIQHKVYQEIVDVIGNVDRDVDKLDIVKLVYIDAVLKETLRLYALAPALPRTIDKDVQLKNCTLKAGSSCILSVWSVHRHAMWGPDVDQFRPERWLCPDNLPDVNYFGSFGLGQRSCIGKKYAMMYMQTMLAHVVRHYRVIADVSMLKLQLDITLKPVSGHNVRLERRL